MKNHIAITHEGERPYNCMCCTETFTRKSAMTRHIKRKHPEMLENLWKKPHEEVLEELDDKVFLTDAN